jgi:nucleoside-diphosphate-sugar epimerase
MTGKLVVVAGAAGRLGRLVVEALLATPGARVRALVRDPARAADLAAAGAEVVAFDLVEADDAARAAAVAGAFAVISTAQGGPDVIIDGQLALLRAAKAAGARRFLPSDYSYDLFGLPAGVNLNTDWRRGLAELAAAEITASFEVVHLMQGIFADAGVLGFLGLFDARARTIRYWGDGRTPIDWTTWEDTARFAAAAALDDRPVPERLYVRGDRRDVFGFAEDWAAARGEALTLVSLGDLDALAAETTRRLTETPHDMYGWLPLMYARGVFGGEAVLPVRHNDLYPEIAAEPLRAAITRGAVG